MITIQKSKTADTRSCDSSKVTRTQLVNSTSQHMGDVIRGLRFFENMLKESGIHHDDDKLTNFDQFHHDFLTGFKETTWWDNHRKINRHHLSQKDGVPKDINLVDVIEYITDCVMAGMARTGKVYKLELPDELLKKAFDNTVELLKSQIKVKED